MATMKKRKGIQKKNSVRVIPVRWVVMPPEEVDLSTPLAFVGSIAQKRVDSQIMALVDIANDQIDAAREAVGK